MNISDWIETSTGFYPVYQPSYDDVIFQQIEEEEGQDLSLETEFNAIECEVF